MYHTSCKSKTHVRASSRVTASALQSPNPRVCASTSDASRTSSECLSQPSVECPEQSFTHLPIDLHNDSIRLLEVLPAKANDPNGIIKCKIRHGTTAASYTCLSYVWGPEDPTGTRKILINGKPFSVRRNLGDFLEIASRRQARENNVGLVKSELNFEEAMHSLWIDALCIDQQNVLERNHQVQQMGMIYWKADRVIAWFGKNQKLRHWFPHAGRLAQEYLEFDDCQDFVDGLKDLCRDDYWQRAWITQETILAQTIYYLADDEALCHDTTLATALVFIHLLRTNLSIWTRQMLYREDHDRTLRREGRKLLQNLADYSGKSCLDPRDKIYSLLSISCDVSDIAVDYDVSPTALATKLSDRLGPPCMCRAASIELLFDTLGLSSGCSCAMFKLRLSPIHTEGSCEDFSEEFGGAFTRLVKGDDPQFFYRLDCAHVEINEFYPELIHVSRYHNEAEGTHWKVQSSHTDRSSPPLRDVSVESIDADGNAVFRVSLAQFCGMSNSHLETVGCLESNMTKRMWEFLPDSEIAVRDCCRFE